MKRLIQASAFLRALTPDLSQPQPRFNYRKAEAQALAAILAFAFLSTTVFAAVPEIDTDKDAYAPDEAINVYFRNSPGNSNDWITLVPQATPDGKYREWKWIRATEGTVTFRGVKEGVYEVRIHLKGTHSEPSARHVLKVSDGRAEATEPVTAIPGSGAKLGEEPAGHASSANDIPVGVWSAQFSCRWGNAPKQFAARLLTLDAHGDQAFFQFSARDGTDDQPRKFALLNAGSRNESGSFEYEYAYSMLINTLYDLIIRPVSDDRLSVDFGHCENISFQRDAADFPRPEFEGNWTGVFEACTGSEGEAQLTLFKAHQGNVFADMDFQAYPHGWSKKSYPGRAYLYGTWNDSTGEYAFTTLINGRATRSGEKGVNWGGLKGLNLSYNEISKSLVGKSESCSYAELHREDRELSPNRINVSFAERLPGTWEGESICRDGDTFFGFKIEALQSGRLAGVLDIAGPDALMRGVSGLNVHLRESSQQGELQGAVESAGAALHSFKITATDREDTITIKEESLGCGTINLTRVDEAALSRIPTAEASDGGSFYVNRRPQDRCEAIIALPKRFEREFPETPMRGSRSENIYSKLVLLFADDDWVPVFGKAFDMTPLNERREIRSEARQLCYDDPFYRDDYSKFAMLDRGLGGDMERPLTSFGLPAIHVAIRQVRETRHLLDQKVDETLASSETSDAAAKARGVSAFMKNNSERLWPSEIDARENLLSDHVAGLALQDVEVELDGLNDVADPAARLAALSKIAKGQEEYHRYLDDRNMRKLKARAIGQQSKLARDALSDDLAEIEALPHDETGLVQLEQKASEVDTTISLLVGSVAESFQTRIDQKRQSILDASYKQKMGVLKAIKPGPAGLDASLAWLESFESLFTPYQKLIAFDKAVTEFTDKRASLLEGSLGRFEKEVEQAASEGGPDAIELVLTRYLAWESDETIPVWLDYQFIAESYK